MQLSCLAMSVSEGAVLLQKWRYGCTQTCMYLINQLCLPQFLGVSISPSTDETLGQLSLFVQENWDTFTSWKFLLVSKVKGDKWFFVLVRFKAREKERHFQQCCTLVCACSLCLKAAVHMSLSQLISWANPWNSKMGEGFQNSSLAWPTTLWWLWNWAVGSCVHQNLSAGKCSPSFTLLHCVCLMRVTSQLQLKRHQQTINCNGVTAKAFLVKETSVIVARGEQRFLQRTWLSSARTVVVLMKSGITQKEP